MKHEQSNAGRAINCLKKAGSNLKRILVVMLLIFRAATLAADECKLDQISGPHATLVVYRYRLFVGSGRRASIYLDDRQICSLSNGRYLIIEVPEGKHKLRSSDDKHGGIEQNFLPGQIFYYRVHVEATSPLQLTNFWVLDSVPDDRARDELRVLHAQEGETKSLPTIAQPEH
jgi:hypothetical protein